MSFTAEQKRAYYAANREGIAIEKKAYYTANREAISAQKREYYSRKRAERCAASRAYHHADPERARDKKLRKFGLTAKQYDAMLETQSGVCAICGGVNGDGRRLAVDHDHTTGAVRGLLCASCNRGIGYLRDEPDYLRAAAEYLERAHDPREATT